MRRKSPYFAGSQSELLAAGQGDGESELGLVSDLHLALKDTRSGSKTKARSGALFDPDRALQASRAISSEARPGERGPRFVVRTRRAASALHEGQGEDAAQLRIGFDDRDTATTTEVLA